MDDMLLQFRKNISAAYLRKSRIVWKSTRFVKVALVLLGSLLAGSLAFFSGGVSWPLSNIQVGGLIGGLMAFSGGVYIAITDEDTSDILDEARRAIDWAAGQELAKNEILDLAYRYEDATEQLTSLYTVSSVTRGAIERAIFESAKDTKTLIRTCLATTKRNLRIALNFGLSEIWTICVYEAVGGPESDNILLKLIAHDRSLDCEIEKARSWKVGVGVGGVAYAKNDEVVVPDLDDPAVGTVFRLEKAQKKEEDRERYKSIFAVPVMVGDDDKPWGVVLATSNVSHHFGNSTNDGVDPEEGVRALAGVVALAVAVCRKNYHAVSPPSQEETKK